MQKRRAGLQKDFSDIFEGVWIPKKPREACQSRQCNVPHESKQTESDEILEQAKEIVEKMNCQKGFECVNSGFTNVCEARLIGNGEMLECLADSRQACQYRVSFANKNFCKCKLRFFIAKKMNK